MKNNRAASLDWDGIEQSMQFLILALMTTIGGGFKVSAIVSLVAGYIFNILNNQIIMKRFLTCTLGLILVTAIIAQDDQGNSSSSSSGNSPNMWLGGAALFGNMSNRDFTIAPVFGIMINDKMGVGGTLVYSSGNNSNAWGIEPCFRYYIPIVEKFSFYGDAYIGIGGGDNDTSVDAGEFNTLDFGARIGLQYWLAPRWSLAASNNVFNYSSINGNGDFGVGVNFNSVNFSFFFHF